MNDEHGQLTDVADEQEAQQRQDDELQQWLADEAAQREYQSWLDALKGEHCES